MFQFQVKLQCLLGFEGQTAHLAGGWKILQFVFRWCRWTVAVIRVEKIQNLSVRSQDCVGIQEHFVDFVYLIIESDIQEWAKLNTLFDSLHPSCCCFRCPPGVIDRQRCPSRWRGSASACVMMTPRVAPCGLSGFDRRNQSSYWCATDAACKVVAPQCRWDLSTSRLSLATSQQLHSGCYWFPALPELLSICLALGSHCPESGSDLWRWSCSDNRRACGRWSWWGFWRCFGTLCTHRWDRILAIIIYAAGGVNKFVLKMEVWKNIWATHFVRSGLVSPQNLLKSCDRCSDGLSH